MKEDRRAENKKTSNDISVANLPGEFTIQDPRKLIAEIRSNFLRRARENKKLSLVEVSKMLGISEEELSSVEAGKINASHMGLLYKMSELYGLGYAQLLSLFKLAKENAEKDYGIAAFHSSELDTETEEELKKLIRLMRRM